METIIGIDLGTTNSEVAVVRNGKVEVLREEGEAILPSVVGLDPQGRLLVGAPVRNQWVLAPERTVRSIKRKMGQDVTVALGPENYTPQEISAMILRTLKGRAERELGHPVRKAVITVPAFFSEIQREATRQAGEMAGLEVVRIINEPTAASLTYDPHPDKMERLLVYDLGGGTFDVSIVQIEQGVVEVLASHGDTQLGGDDFDQLLLDHVCGQFKEEHGIDLRDALVSKSRVLKAVEEAKKMLSFEPVVTIQEEFIAEKKGVPLHLNLEIQRPDYEDLIEPLVAKTLQCVDAALTDARLNVRQIDKIVLVGGASRTPMIHHRLQSQLGQVVHSEVDPDLCVAMGAAIQGGMIAGVDVGPVLVDITPHTLGIQAMGVLHGFESVHCFSPIIERNTPLPASRAEIFSTVFDEQPEADIEVFQGENDDVRHNEHVGGFRVQGLAEVQRGNEVLVRFDLNLDGILTVTAVERATGLHKQLVIDNAVSRFHARSRADAQSRIDVAFGPETEALPVEPLRVVSADVRDPAESGGGDHGADAMPESWREAVARCRTLIAKAEQIAPDANPEDRTEIGQLVEKLWDAIAARSTSEVEKTAAELEDLIFYLQDA